MEKLIWERRTDEYLTGNCRKNKGMGSKSTDRQRGIQAETGNIYTGDGKMNILQEIAEKTKERIVAQQRQLPLNLLRQSIEEQQGAASGGGRFPFYEALAREGISYICEVKKASPSKGVIAEEFPYRQIALEYEQAGAAAISCLTEPYYFQGTDEYLEEIVRAVNIPVLRKDFVVDEYMIYQAKALGAAAILLICAILEDAQLAAYLQLAEELGLDALVEAHDEGEVQRALTGGARILGVNNRDLRTFRVDVENSIRLRSLAPPEVLFVSESGIRAPEDIQRLQEHQVNGVLIGETLMKSPNKKAALEALNGGPLFQE